MARFATPVLPTEEEKRLIKAKDQKTISRVFCQNWDFILNVCKGYWNNTEREQGKHNTLFQDMFQDVYLRFNEIDFTSVATFARNIKDIALTTRFGGQWQFDAYRQGVCEVVQTMDIWLPSCDGGGQRETYGETIPDRKNLLDEVQPPHDFCDVVFDTIIPKICADRQCKAIKLHCETDLTDREIGAQMGVSINGARSLRLQAVETLRQNLPEFMQELANVGYDTSRYSQAIICDVQETALNYKKSLYEKAKARRCERLQNTNANTAVKS